MTRRGKILIALALATFGGSARAQQPPFQPTELPELAESPRLRVMRSESAADCPDAEALAASVGQHLGRPALETGDGGSEALGFDVHFDRNEQGYVALVLRRGARGSERRLADPGTSCAGLAEALSVTLAILVDEAPLPTPRTAEGLGVGRAIRRPPPPKPQPPPEERSFGVAALAEGVGTFGVLAGAWPGIAGEIELTIEPLSFGAGVLYVPTQAFQPDDNPTGAEDAHIDLKLAAATARGCLGHDGGRWRAAGCALFAIGKLSGGGSGYTTVSDVSNTWLAAGAFALARVRLVAPVHLSARLGALFPFTSTSYEIEQDTITPKPNIVLYRTSRLAAYVGVGVAVAIW